MHRLRQQPPPPNAVRAVRVQSRSRSPANLEMEDDDGEWQSIGSQGEIQPQTPPPWPPEGDVAMEDDQPMMVVQQPITPPRLLMAPGSGLNASQFTRRLGLDRPGFNQPATPPELLQNIESPAQGVHMLGEGTNTSEIEPEPEPELPSSAISHPPNWASAQVN